MDGRVHMGLGSLTAAILLLAFATRESLADQMYRVEGHDTFQIGSSDLRGEIAYTGHETLAITRHGKTTHYVARVSYERKDQGATSRAQGLFASTILPSGEQHDEVNHDPDYLTVLNQPFSVQLDAGTLHDIEHLHGRVPFDFPSPITGAPLHGYLEHGSDALVDAVPAVRVNFSADGPLDGRLPDHPGMTLRGTIHMSGIAYYDRSNALLASLDATLTIAGNVANSGSNEPVKIVYRRMLHPQSGAAEARAVSR